MSEQHVTAWLAAYHDGELNPRKAQQVEAHIAHCAACRAELDSLTALSAMLHAVPPATCIHSPERFVTQVALQLPRRPEKTPWQRALEMGWRLVPVALMGIWLFIQTVALMTTGVQVIQSIGPGDLAIGPLFGPAGSAPWQSELWNFSGSQPGDLIEPILYTVLRGGPLGWRVTLNFLLLVGLGLLYWSWLASWWIRQRHIQNSNLSVRS